MKIEPWAVKMCAVCFKKYHFIDGAKCDCGKDESERLKTKHLGGFIIGTTKQ